MLKNQDLNYLNYYLNRKFAGLFSLHNYYKKSITNACNCLLLVCVSVFSINANALIILQQASISSNTEFDNNPTLTTTNAESIWRYSFNPQYSVTASDEKNRFFSNLGLNIVRSSNKNITADREDPNLNLGWDHELERGRFSIIGVYNRTSSRFREFRNTGFVDNDGTSVSKSLSAVWNYAITERLDYSLGGNLTKNINSGNSALVQNSLRKSINTTLTYAVNEVVSPFLQFSYTKFNPSGLGSIDNNSKNYITGLRYSISPQLSTSISTGITDISTGGRGKLINANLDYISERYSAGLTAGRNSSPSDIGQFQESDSFAITYNYLLSDKSSLNADYFISKNNSAESNLNITGANNETKSSRFGGSYLRELTPLLQMRVSVSAQQNKSNTQKVNGEVVSLFFTYNTPEF